MQPVCFSKNYVNLRQNMYSLLSRQNNSHSDVIVSLSEDVEAIFRPNNELVVATRAAAPESVIANIEACREPMESCEGVV